MDHFFKGGLDRELSIGGLHPYPLIHLIEVPPRNIVDGLKVSLSNREFKVPKFQSALA